MIIATNNKRTKKGMIKRIFGHLAERIHEVENIRLKRENKVLQNYLEEAINENRNLTNAILELRYTKASSVRIEQMQ